VGNGRIRVILPSKDDKVIRAQRKKQVSASIWQKPDREDGCDLGVSTLTQPEAAYVGETVQVPCAA
jgi:hypothetical protein